MEFTGTDLTTMKEQTDISQRISVLAGHGSVEKVSSCSIAVDENRSNNIDGRCVVITTVVV